MNALKKCDMYVREMEGFLCFGPLILVNTEESGFTNEASREFTCQQGEHEKSQSDHMMLCPHEAHNLFYPC